MKKQRFREVINDLPKATELLYGGTRIGLQNKSDPRAPVLPSVPLLPLSWEEKLMVTEGSTPTLYRGLQNQNEASLLLLGREYVSQHVATWSPAHLFTYPL